MMVMSRWLGIDDGCMLQTGFQDGISVVGTAGRLRCVWTAQGKRCRWDGKISELIMYSSASFFFGDGITVGFTLPVGRGSRRAELRRRLVRFRARGDGLRFSQMRILSPSIFYFLFFNT